MGNVTDKKYKKAVDLADSVKGVQTRLTQKKLQEINAKHTEDIKQANKDKAAELGYVNIRDNHLVDRKIWNNKDQISLYELGYMKGRRKAAVYYEQDKKECPREEQFAHMMDIEFDTLEAATVVFKALCESFNLIMSPCTENHVVGKPYKVVVI